jgi:hypothetical protein
VNGVIRIPTTPGVNVALDPDKVESEDEVRV